jgi:hypothetical protein
MMWFESQLALLCLIENWAERIGGHFVGIIASMSFGCKRFCCYLLSSCNDHTSKIVMPRTRR